MAATFTIDSGFGETQGRRDTMEDAHVVFDDILKVENIGITEVPGHRVSYYGVYDGHGGVRRKLCAAFLWPIGLRLWTKKSRPKISLPRTFCALSSIIPSYTDPLLLLGRCCQDGPS